MRTLRTLLPLMLLAAALGCGNGDNNNNKNNGTDTGIATDSGGGGTDTRVEDMGGATDMRTAEDMGRPDVGPADLGTDTGAGDMGEDVGTTDMGGGPCTRNGLMVVQEEALFDEVNDQFIYSGFNADSELEMHDFLSFEVYPYLGGVIGAQDVTFNGTNYMDCNTCMLVFADCAAGGSCTKIFLADSGSINVTEMGALQDDPFKATFSQLVFSEVTIDLETYESTKVVGGETYCVEMATADTVTTEL